MGKIKSDMSAETTKVSVVPPSERRITYTQKVQNSILTGYDSPLGHTSTTVFLLSRGFEAEVRKDVAALRSAA